MQPLDFYSTTFRTEGPNAGLPTCALMVDDNGLRWLLTDFPFPEGLWRRAIASGAHGLLYDGGLLSVEDVASLRRQDGTILPPTAVAERSPGSDHPFVHLHAHSEYSSLDGLSMIEEMVATAVADGQGSMALTDHGVCAGHLELQKECRKNGIKPIFGTEANFVFEARDKSPENLKGYWHFILLAKNQKGLHNLWRASTLAHSPDRFYGRPRMDWEVLRECAEGLYATTACLRGPISAMIEDGDEQGAKEMIGRLRSIFGDDMCLELHANQMERQKVVNRGLVSIAQEMSLPMIVVGDSHYACTADKEAHGIWIAAQTNKTLSDDGDLFAGHEDYHMHTGDDIVEAISYLGRDVAEAAVAMTVEIASLCDATATGRNITPVYHRKPVPQSPLQGGALDFEVMKSICENAWNDRVPPEALPGGEMEATYRAVLEMELAEFSTKQFAGYMLIVWDYCLDPSTPVLTDDLRWVEVGKLQPGDRLAGFDDDKVVAQSKSHRYWRSTEVVQTRRIVQPTYKVVLDDGTETITSGDHKWLMASPNGGSIRWMQTKKLRPGQRAQRLVREWDEVNTWEAGYIAGILDGEGHLSSTPNNTGGRQTMLGFSQNRGAVLDTALRILDSWGFKYAVRDHSSGSRVQCVNISGGRSEVMRLLGMTRPQRLLAKFDVDLLGRTTAIDQPAVVSVEYLGDGEVVALETTSGTLVAKGFAHHNCNWCRENRILMGPGRGSAAGSLVCFLMGITQIDPIEAGLLFERFISPGRTQLPDVDSDFPASKRGAVTDYIVSRWGAEHAVRVGTVVRLRNKGTFKDVARVLKGSDREVSFVAQADVAAIITRAESGTAGMGLSWDDLWTHVGTDLAPYEEAYPDWFKFAAQLVGRLKSYGKHPAGIVIDPEESLIDLLPLRQGEDDHPITEFPMDQLDELGFVKFDILTVRTLDTIQEVMDLVESDPRYTGRVPHPHTWRRQEYADPMVWEMLRRGETLGIFQVETGEGTRLVNQFRPESLADLCAILTLVRPGPKNSGLTASYLRRRDGVEQVQYIHPLLETVLCNTYGCMVYQEDIMNTVKVMAGYTSAEADEVRSILGKKKVDKIAAEGTRFVSRSLSMGIEQHIADTIFEQMAEFAKYSFNKSHSWAYAALAYWCAWYKCHFPIHFLVACLSTADKDRFPEFVADARRRGYRIDLPDVNESKVAFSVSSDGLGIRYGLSSVKNLGTKAADDVMANAPYSSWDDFVERRGKACNWGHIKTLVSIGALDRLIPEGHNRVDLAAICDQMADGKIEQCRWLRAGHQPSMGMQSCCEFDWSAEERPLGKSGKPLKAKPLPKSCTRACRQYDPVTALVWPHNSDPTPVQIRRAERESFGLYVTSTPFDALNLEGMPTVAEMTTEGYYQVVGEIQSVRTRPDSLGRKMAFITLTVPDGSIDVVCFTKLFAQMEQVLRPDAFGVFSVERNKRGFALNQFVPMSQE